MSVRPARRRAPEGAAESAADAITVALEEDIIFGRLGPRARLVEDELMARFGAKRHMVREALARLVTMGIAVKEPNRGAWVRTFDAAEVEQVYQVRAILQRAAAELIPLPADPALLAALRAIHARHSAAVARAALREVLRLNTEFHETLFGGCGNPHLVDAIRHYADLIHAIRSFRIADPVMLAQARDEHGEMIAALAAGDRARLVRLCIDHILPSKLAYLATWSGARAVVDLKPRS